ncbi:O-antigen ligase family protein [bacterium SCSIO 12741]|nr:O-antigen ligase family protein [bacterium SCSIO 12741]
MIFGLLLLAQRNYLMIFMSFWYLLILSDNFYLEFATQVKPLYMVIVFIGGLMIYRQYGYTNHVLRNLTPFLLLAMAMVFVSPDLGLSARKYLSYCLLVISAPFYMKYFTEHQPRTALKGIVTFSALIIISCLVFGSISEYGISHGGRLRGIFGNPNGLAMYCLFTLLFFETVKSKLEDKGFGRRERIFFYLIVIVTLLYSGSRAALMSVLIFYVFNYITSRISLAVGLLMVGTLIFVYDFVLEAGVYVLTEVGLQDELRLEGSQGVETGSGRLIAWRFAWEEIQKNFFLGRGWAYDEIWIFGPIQILLETLNHQGGVHNTYLIVWLNNGLIGLILFLGGLLATFTRAAKKSKLAFPALYAAFFQANFEPWLGASLNPYTVIFFMTVTLQLSELKWEEVEEKIPAFVSGTLKRQF